MGYRYSPLEARLCNLEEWETRGALYHHMAQAHQAKPDHHQWQQPSVLGRSCCARGTYDMVLGPGACPTQCPRKLYAEGLGDRRLVPCAQFTRQSETRALQRCRHDPPTHPPIHPPTPPPLPPQPPCQGAFGGRFGSNEKQLAQSKQTWISPVKTQSTHSTA